MTKPQVFALGVGLGAWITPLGILLGYRIAGRHELDSTYRSEHHA